jgi:hypothetical protein
MTTYPKFFGSSVFPYGVERRRPGVDPQRLLQQLRRIFICPRRTPRIGKVLIQHRLEAAVPNPIPQLLLYAATSAGATTEDRIAQIASESVPAEADDSCETLHEHRLIMPKQCPSGHYARRFQGQESQAGNLATRHGAYICGCHLPPHNCLTNGKRGVLRVSMSSPAGQLLPALAHHVVHSASFLKPCHDLPETSMRQLCHNLHTGFLQSNAQLSCHPLHNLFPGATRGDQWVCVPDQPGRRVKKGESSHRLRASFERASLLARNTIPRYRSFNRKAGQRGDSLRRGAKVAE